MSSSALLPSAARLAVNSLEIPLTQHCNLRCAACDHASPFNPQSFLDIKQIRSDLDVLGHAMCAKELRLVGGEPLQHPDLLAIMDVARSAGIAQRVVVVTNGMLLHKMEEPFWTAVNKIRLSLYPGVSLPLPLTEIEELCRRHNVELDTRTQDKFRISLVNNRIEGADFVKAIYKDCKTAHVWKCYTVHDGYFYKCSKSSVMRDRLLQLGVVTKDSPRDGIDLRSPADLKSRLSAYLQSREPLASCQACLGTWGPSIPHRQLNAAALRAEAAEDHRALIDQVRLKHQNRIKDGSRETLQAP